MHALCIDSGERCLRCSKQLRECETNVEFAELFAPEQRAVTCELQTGSMKRLAFPTTEQTVDDVMQRWPSTIRVFLAYGMHCVGCPIATFHSVDEACSEHGVDLELFLRSLHQAAQMPADAGFGWPSASPNSP